MIIHLHYYGTVVGSFPSPACAGGIPADGDVGGHPPGIEANTPDLFTSETLDELFRPPDDIHHGAPGLRCSRNLTTTTATTAQPTTTTTGGCGGDDLQWPR